MQAARFVTYCFVYIGPVIMAQYALFYGISFELNSLVQFAGGLAILGIGGVRLWKPEEEQYPEEYGLLTAVARRTPIGFSRGMKPTTENLLHT